MKQKDFQLLKRLDVNINYVPVLVTACCVLHNICEVHGESFSDNWLEDVGHNITGRTMMVQSHPIKGTGHYLWSQ